MSSPESREVRDVDIAIIGSGSGNSIADDRFADRSVAIIEANPVFGGTCLNVGCIPTKMFVYSAKVAAIAREAARYGVDATLDGVRWPDIVERVFGRIDPMSRGGAEWRRTGMPNVSLISGHARFVEPRTLAVTDGPDAGTVLRARQVVLAAGARPSIPEAIAASGVAVHTSDTIMRIPEFPKRLLIVGSGTIAAEFAGIFGGLGSQVTMVARHNLLLRSMDEDVAQTFTRLAEKQWDVRVDVEVAALSGPGADEPAGPITVTLTDDSTLECDAVLVATGRTPNGDLLDAARGGVEVDKRGLVRVDRFGRTTATNVWALGDISSADQLKHVANAEARVIAENLGKDWEDSDALTPLPQFPVPRAVFTHPEIAAVGLTERQARESGADITVATKALGDVAFGWAIEDTDGFCKLIADRSTGELLGASIVGPSASVVIQPVIQAMSFGLSAREMARGQYWIHPALTEVLENALLALDL